MIFTGKTILIVDDSSLMQKKLAQAYQGLGLEIGGVVQDGYKALQFLQHQPVDYVSLDIIMPEMDGMECFKQMRQSFPMQVCFFVSVLCADTKFMALMSKHLPAPLFIDKNSIAHNLGARLEEAIEAWKGLFLQAPLQKNT